MNQELIKRLREKESKMIEIRRYLHEHPELSFHETETPQYLSLIHISEPTRRS